MRVAVGCRPYRNYERLQYIVVTDTVPGVRLQQDGISCGPFVVAYAYWFAFHVHTFPSIAQFPGPDAHVYFRLALINLLYVSGHVHPPLAPPPQ